jgi:hypothetical protein
LILLCVTQHGCETLTEIENPDHVDELSTICRKNNPRGMTAAFNDMLLNIGREPAHGFADTPRQTLGRGGQNRA